MNILIIDDEKDCCDALEFFIESIGDYNIYKSYDSIEGLNLIKKQKIDLVFSDVNMPTIDGIEFTKIVKNRKKNIEVVLISGKKDIISSINAIDYGALDFIAKPASGEKVKRILNKIELQIKNKTKVKKQKFDISKLPDDDIVNIDDLLSYYDSYYDKNIGYVGFFSNETRNICNKLKKLADYPEIPVLIEGRTGVGKEVFAKYLHYNGPRAKEPFVAINCATIGKEIFESELFGYESGAFTGADPKGKEGKIKLAENGTLFLDEITEIPISHQAKLLRVLQEKEYYKLSSGIRQSVNTTIVCATNKNLSKLVEQGLFREDLYYRLNICNIIIPPLQKRKEEIIPLSLLFLQELNKRNKVKITSIEVKFLKHLLNYNWPGNIRELKNTLTKITMFNEKSIIKAFDLILLPNKTHIVQKIIDTENFILPENSLDLENYINNIILSSLAKFKGNKTKTAEYLQIQRKKLYHKYKV